MTPRLPRAPEAPMPDVAGFLAPFRVHFVQRPSARTLERDVTGLLTEHPHKNCDTLAAVVGLVHVLVPFMVLSIAAVLEKLDRRVEEAAHVLGASRTQAFLRVILPLSLDGVASGTILVFMLAMGSFVTLLFLGGGSVKTFPLLIYQQFNTTRDFGMAAAMSNVLMALAVVLMFVQLRLIRRSGVS